MRSPKKQAKDTKQGVYLGTWWEMPNFYKNVNAMQDTWSNTKGGPIWGSWWELPNFSIRTTALSTPLCQVRRCAKCVTAQMHHSTKHATAPDAPWHQTRHNSGHATPFTTAVRTLPRQAGCGGNVIAAAEASAGTAFFLSTKITENTWKSGLRCDKIQIWI